MENKEKDLNEKIDMLTLLLKSTIKRVEKTELDIVILMEEFTEEEEESGFKSSWNTIRLF